MLAVDHAEIVGQEVASGTQRRVGFMAADMGPWIRMIRSEVHDAPVPLAAARTLPVVLQRPQRQGIFVGQRCGAGLLVATEEAPEHTSSGRSVVLAPAGTDVELAADLAELLAHLGHPGFRLRFRSG